MTYQYSGFLIVTEEVDGLIALFYAHGAKVIEKGNFFLVENATQDLGQAMPLREDCVIC